MSLDLTKYREANHERVAVGGSYTDTWIECQGKSATSSNTSAYVRWVPNNKSGSGYLAGVSTTQFANYGYLEYPLSGVGITLFEFAYYDDTNTYNGGATSPGIKLSSVETFGGNEGGADELAAAISSLPTDTIYVIVNNRSVASSTNLYNTMNQRCRSWRWLTGKGSSTTATDHTYAAIGTNINDIGFLSEVLNGPSATHTGAYSNVVIEHQKNTIGHAGYGEELSSGIGAGAVGLDMDDGTSVKEVDWGFHAYGKYNLSPNEHVRATWEQKIGQGAELWGGYLQVTLREESVTGTLTHDIVAPVDVSKSVDGWTKGEMTLHKQNSNTTQRLEIEFAAYDGSGSGRGNGQLNIKNLEVYKCGVNPDQSRDASVHMYHVNGLNIEESPGPFRLGDPDEFYAFWQSDRNLNSRSYTSFFTNTGTQASPKRPMSYQYVNSSSTNYGIQGEYNYIHWFNQQLNSSGDTGNTQNYGFVKEAFNATANHTNNIVIGGLGDTGITVDPTKVYLAGVWMRVRRSTGTNTGYSPNRISMVGRTASSSGAISSYGTTSSSIADGQNYLQSIYETNFDFEDGTYQSWKMLSGFFLPHWMTATERLEWKNNYWAKWAGHFEHGEGTNTSQAISGITGYGLNSATAGYVCGMPSNTTQIYPTIRIEQYSSTDLWAEFMYPYIIEIDPMNINDKGNIYFWDFTENLP